MRSWHTPTLLRGWEGLKVAIDFFSNDSRKRLVAYTDRVEGSDAYLPLRDMEPSVTSRDLRLLLE